MGQEIYRDFAYRQDRVRSALWVYASIAIQSGELQRPWDKIHEHWPHTSAPEISSCFHLNPKAFEEGLHSKILPVEEALSRWDDYKTVLSTIVNHRTSAVLPKMNLLDDIVLQNDSTEDMDDFRQALDLIYTGSFLTGDEMSANTPAILAFRSLALSDWQHCLIDLRDGQMGSESLVSSFCEIVSERHNDIQSYLSTVTVEAYGLPSLSQRSASHGMKDDDMNMDYASSASSSICVGRRWHELQRLLGKEVILLDNSCSKYGNFLECPINLPEIVETGSERCFSALKEIIPSRLNWLAKTCKKLSGALEIIIHLQEKQEDDCRESLEKRITAIILGAFGERSLVESVTSMNIDLRLDWCDSFQTVSSES